MIQSEEYQTCPVCNGEKEVPLSEQAKQYSWNEGKTHRPCSNCGGQYQFGKPKGVVPLDKDGNPCTHNYIESPGRYRCTHNYVCKNCGDSYVIDSSD